MRLRLCMVHIITALVYLLSQPTIGEATGTNIAEWRYRRDAEDQYYDPSTRTGCPPSMTSAGGTGGGTGGGSSSSGAPVKYLLLIIDTTLSNGKAFNEYVNLVLKIRNYAKDAYVGAVSLNCHSEAILRFGRHSDEEIKKAILAQKPRNGKKAISEAFNLADLLISSGVSDRSTARVVVLSDSVSDDCSGKPSVDAFQIAAHNWRSTDVKILFVATGKKTAEMERIAGDSVVSLQNSATVEKSLYQKVAKWVCTGGSTGSVSGPSVGVTSRSSSSAGTTQSSSSSRTTQSSSSSRMTQSSSRSAPATTKDVLPGVPHVPGSGNDLALLMIIDITILNENLFKSVIDYVVKISDHVPKARIGIIEISCPSKTLLGMGTYSGQEIRTKATLPTDLPKEKGTAQALELGKKILESETRKHKVVLMISDGRKTTCPKDKPKDDEIKIAEVLRKLGIKIVYSATGKNPDKKAIAEITGDPKLTITLGDLIKIIEELKKSVASSNSITGSTASSSTTSSTASSSTSASTTKSTKAVGPPVIPSSGADTSVVFIVDFTESCQDQFDAEIDYVLNIANNFGNARIGVVEISCPSETLVRMGVYTESELRDKLSPPKSPSNKKGTAQALFLAKHLLANEVTSHRYLILISDGKRTTCSKNRPMFDEFALAKQLREMGIPIYYPAVGREPDMNNIKKITDDTSLIFSLDDLNKLLEELRRVLGSFVNIPSAVTSRTTRSTSRRTPSRKGDRLPSIPRSGEDMSVVFIVDFTKSCEDHFDAAIDYVVNVAENMEEARIGAVSIDCPSETLLRMGTYTSFQIRRKLSPPRQPTRRKGTAQAFYLAKKLLARERTGYKFLVVISDGEETTCSRERPKNDEIAIAKKLQRMGVTILYPTVGDDPDKFRIKRITGDRSLIFSLDDLAELLETIVEYRRQRPRRPKPSIVCATEVESRAVLFILDQTSTVGEDGIAQAKKFMRGLLEYIAADLRAGVVVIACPSYKGLAMNDYTAAEVKEWAEKRKLDVRSSSQAMFTGTYDAYKLGQEMLDGDDSDSKVVVVLSDGQTSNCKGDIEIGYDPSIDKKEFEIAKKWRENGIKIIFVRVGEDRYDENIKEIVGNDDTSILSVHDYSKLDKSVITGVAKKICSEEHF